MRKMTRMEYLRRKRGLTQGELGEKIFYTASLISSLETGRKTKTHPAIKNALERLFGEPFEKLMSYDQ